MISLLDMITLTADLSDQAVRQGQVGTVVELLSDGVFLVEFSDYKNRTYTLLPLQAHQLKVLHYDTGMAA
ncbi:DUF4926 domain-containing protein [Leptolyngbya sp. FACHB-261]|uniref:DUF4926 domain-containing protein n=1 Tax=Leptolyngbya sp. FACHB-261 TaxID=2692806 RepID=UPI001687B82D|nr:DUF4926 domain-containing protein [Leptolyngbya sp. FACHB-261]MBD2099803.1 DUF4926 domain-containing protein [Leptolyngbya sp. FACHB-261]